MTRTPLRRAAGIALAGLLLPALARATTVSEGAEAPNVAGVWLNHETTTLKDLRGHAVLLEFWGTH